MVDTEDSLEYYDGDITNISLFNGTLYTTNRDGDLYEWNCFCCEWFKIISNKNVKKHTDIGTLYGLK